MIVVLLSMSVFTLTACDFLTGGGNNNGGNNGDNGGNNGGDGGNGNNEPSGTPSASGYDITLVWNNGGDSDVYSTKANGFLNMDDVVEIRDKEKVAKGGYVFQGWYFDADFSELADKADEFTSDATLYAKWSKTETYTTEGNGNAYVYFGEYPQSAVTDQTLVEALKNLAGSPPSGVITPTSEWKSLDGSADLADAACIYTDVAYNGEKYRCVYVRSSNSEQLNNGYIADKTYWFRFDPIKWYVYDKDGSYDPKLVSTVVLDAMQFYNEAYTGVQDRDGATGVYANDYGHSDIRKMLLDEFYNTAFSETQKSLIKTSSVVNKLTDKSDENYNSTQNQTNTEDKIYLLSFNQVFRQIETGTYFAGKPSRQKAPSDYAKCKGVKVVDGSAQWWIRTPRRDANSTYIVNNDGEYGNVEVTVDYTAGLLPALIMAWE